MGHTGLEPEGVSSNKTKHLRKLPDDRAALSGASCDKNVIEDPDLALIIERWEHLPEAVKTGIMAMVKASEVES